MKRTIFKSVFARAIIWGGVAVLCLAVYAYVNIGSEVVAIDDIAAPSTPINVAVASSADTSIALQWAASTDDVGVVGYEIFENGILVATAPTNSYVRTGLLGAHAYAYRLKALDASGKRSQASAQLDVTTQPWAPGTFLLGSQVVVTARANIYPVASTAVSRLGAQQVGAVGQITDGPSTVNGVEWWKVDFTSGVDGWLGEYYLVPMVSMTSPAAGTSVSGTVSVAASVAGTGVTGVQFKVDGANIGSIDTVAPYSVSWNTTTVANGSRSLTAVVSTNSTTATSVPRSVTVSNTVATSNTITVVRNASIGDLASIQNTINSAKSGDTVVIPAGQWVVSSTTGIKINNKSNLTIKGEGAGSTSAGTRILGLRPDGAEQTSKGIPAFVVTNATNVTLKDMTVYFGSRTDSGTVGVTLKNTVGAKLEGLYIKEGGGAGIRLDPGTEASQVNKDTVIRDCHIERAGYGLHLRHAKNLLVENCDIHHSTDAVKFDLARDVTDSTFRKNYLHHNERDSMDDANLKDELSGHLERITVEYNIFADNQQSGVEWKNLNYSTAIINDNTFRYNLFLRNPDTGLIMRVHRPYGAANLTAAYSCPNMIYETEVSSNIFYQNGTAPYVSSAAPGGMLILSSCGIAVSNNVFWQNSSVSPSHELTIGLPGSISARIQLNNNYFIDKTTGLYLTTGSSVDTNTNQNLTPSGSTYTQYVALKNTILNGIGSTFLARDPDGNGQTILQQLLLP